MKFKFLLTSGRLMYSRIITKNKHKLPEKEIQKFVYFSREFDLLIRVFRDDSSMAFWEIVVSEIGQEHKNPWLLQQWYTWEHEPLDIYPNCTSPMEKKLYFLCGHTIFAIIFFSFCFLWFLESFSFLPVLAFPVL